MNRTTLLSWLLAGLALAAVCAPVDGQSLISSRGKLTAPGGSAEIWGDARQELIQRLFRATLGRSPSASEAERSEEEIAAGRLGSLIDVLISSSDYRRQRSSMSSSRVIQQLFLGLLERSPTSSELSTLSRELDMGRDAEVVRLLIDSEEFAHRLSGHEGETDEAERACIAAVEGRLAEDLHRRVTVRVLGMETVTTTIFVQELGGEAELTDGSGSRLRFRCRIDRYDGRVSEADYQMEQPTVPTGQPPTPAGDHLLRCHSLDLRYRHCPADTGAAVTLEHQESSAACVEGESWGTDDRGIWVDRGCRAIFRIRASAAPTGELSGSVTGWGFLRQPGRGGWLTAAAVDLRADGHAEIRFRGEVSPSFGGRWYESSGGKIELTLDDDGLAGPRPAGAGSLFLAGDRIERIELAGPGPFMLLFEGERAAVPEGDRFDAAGTGELELADGRRFRIDRAAVELAADGRATLRLGGEIEETLTGLWYPCWAGSVELTVTDTLSGATEGGGSIRHLPDGRRLIEIGGRRTAGAFSIRFESD